MEKQPNKKHVFAPEGDDLDWSLASKSTASLGQANHRAGHILHKQPAQQGALGFCGQFLLSDYLRSSPLDLKFLLGGIKSMQEKAMP